MSQCQKKDLSRPGDCAVMDVPMAAKEESQEENAPQQGASDAEAAGVSQLSRVPTTLKGRIEMAFYQVGMVYRIPLA